MLNEKAIYKIKELVIEEIEKLDHVYKNDYYVSPWLVQTVIEKYLDLRCLLNGEDYVVDFEV